MAGRVGDDELALVGGEIAIGDVDRDALLALGLQAVGEQREIDLAGAGRADLGRVLLDGRELILVDHLGVVEQPADEGDLPSSTLPQVRKRSSSFRSCCERYWWMSEAINADW